MALINRDIPLKLHNPGSWKRIHPQYTWKTELGLGDILGLLPPTRISGPMAQPRIIALHHRRALCIADPVLLNLSDQTGFVRGKPAKKSQPRIPMQVCRMSWVKPVLRRQPPVTPTEINPHADHRALLQKFRWHIPLQRRWLPIADIDPYQTLALFHRVAPHPCLPHKRRVRPIGHRPDTKPVGDVVCPTVITTTDRLRTRELTPPHRQWHSTVSTTILQCIAPALVPNKNQPFPEDL